MINMEIVKYKPEYKNDFIRLSKNWITKYFALESDDFEVFENIDKLIKNGAMIYFAIENGVVYATCMAQPMTNNEWEICKLAADERYDGHGAGSAVFKACMDYALENGANKLTILSNSILKPALHIYEKYGFYEIPVDNTHHYKRVDIQFEYTAKWSILQVLCKYKIVQKNLFKWTELNSVRFYVVRKISNCQ